MATLFRRYLRREGRVTSRLNTHSFFKKLRLMSDREFKDYLLQRSIFSREFVTLYNVALTRLKSEDCKEVVRAILRDEIPANLPTHYEDLHQVLRQIGITDEEFANVQATRTTSRFLDGMCSLLDGDDLEIMVHLRVAGEVMVSVEYGFIVAEIERRFGITQGFYHFHHEHDAVEVGSHSILFERIIEGRITDDLTLQKALNALNRAYDVRAGFFDQFNDVLVLDVVRGIAILAATIIIALGFTTLAKNSTNYFGEPITPETTYVIGP